VFTHDSIALGEDGPTHQPIEHYAALRAIPGLTFLRPADAWETAYAWRTVLEDVHGPAVFSLSRQNLPVLFDHFHGPTSLGLPSPVRSERNVWLVGRNLAAADRLGAEHQGAPGDVVVHGFYS